MSENLENCVFFRQRGFSGDSSRKVQQHDNRGGKGSMSTSPMIKDIGHNVYRRRFSLLTFVSRHDEIDPGCRWQTVENEIILCSATGHKHLPSSKCVELAVTVASIMDRRRTRLCRAYIILRTWQAEKCRTEACAHGWVLLLCTGTFCVPGGPGKMCGQELQFITKYRV